MINIINLEKGVSLYEINNEFYFDLEDLASKIGLSQPKRTIKNFVERRKVDMKKWEILPNGCKLCTESDLYRFLMYTSAAKAIEWQDYVCDEVLPLVRKVGIKAVKELEANRLLNQNRLAPELLPEVAELVDDPVDFLLANNAYRVLGYLPPSEVKPKDWSLAQFWHYVTEVGIDKFDAVYVEKYPNSYTLDGKWYAFKPFEMPDDAEPKEEEKPEIDVPYDIF